MVLDWLAANWDSVVSIYLGLIGVASVIVKLTPTLKDDTFLKKVISFVGKFIALNRK